MNRTERSVYSVLLIPIFGHRERDVGLIPQKGLREMMYNIEFLSRVPDLYVLSSDSPMNMVVIRTWVAKTRVV